MDKNLQEQLRILKLEYIKKLERMIPEFNILLEKTTISIIDELYLKVHTISGTSGMYGLNELSTFSTNFELYLKKIKNDENCYEEPILKGLLIEYINNIENIIKGENNG